MTSLIKDPELKREIDQVWRRKEFVDAIVNGYDTTESGEPVDLFRFSEYVLSSVEDNAGTMQDECRQLILWTLMNGDTGHEDTIKLRREIAYHFVIVVEKI